MAPTGNQPVMGGAGRKGVGTGVGLVLGVPVPCTIGRFGLGGLQSLSSIG